MKRILSLLFCVLFVVLGLSAQENYQIIIVTDTIDDWSQDIIDGFQSGLNGLLSSQNGSADYSIYDTQVNPDTVPGIIEAIQKNEPDLICMVNFPSGFADSLITSQLQDPKYRFVSENIVPVEIGLIESWERPGGNVTGVGVFLPQNSQIRMMKRINPDIQNLVFYSWSAMTVINQWFQTEIARVAEEENIDVEFHWPNSYEEELELLRRYDRPNNDTFVMGGISAFVDRNGNPVDMSTIMAELLQQELQYLPTIAYDESVIKTGALGGASVIWSDIGAQLAEKGFRVLNGENPGEISWEYPRRYNIILNLATARKLGIEFPPELLGAAYRVYTDYEGTFVGR